MFFHDMDNHGSLLPGFCCSKELLPHYIPLCSAIGILEVIKNDLRLTVVFISFTYPQVQNMAPRVF